MKFMSLFWHVFQDILCLISFCYLKALKYFFISSIMSFNMNNIVLFWILLLQDSSYPSIWNWRNSEACSAEGFSYGCKKIIPALPFLVKIHWSCKCKGNCEKQVHENCMISIKCWKTCPCDESSSIYTRLPVLQTDTHPCNLKIPWIWQNKNKS